MKDEQRQEALKRANEKRLAASLLRRGLQDGTTDPIAVLESPPDCVSTWRLFELLEASRYVGKKKVRALNMQAARAGVNLFRPLGELTPSQAAEAAAWLRETRFDWRRRFMGREFGADLSRTQKDALMMLEESPGRVGAGETGWCPDDGPRVNVRTARALESLSLVSIDDDGNVRATTGGAAA